MNKKALMLMANRDKGQKGHRVGVEYEDWGVRDSYPDDYRVESQFRDRQGREHYDKGRFAPTNRMPPYPMCPDDGGDCNTPQMGSRYYPTYPPIYEDEGRLRKMNPIGFAPNMGGSDATMPQYNEMERMPGHSMKGYAESQYAPRFDRQMAEEWAEQMENEDGSKGPHWSIDQAKQVMAQKGIDESPWEFYVALNAMYSDYSKVAKKLGVNNVDFYACMAEAFLDDKDAVGGGGGEKLARYYESVVKH